MAVGGRFEHYALAVPFAEPKPEPDATLEWPPRCPKGGEPTESVEQLRAGRIRQLRPKYRLFLPVVRQDGNGRQLGGIRMKMSDSRHPS
jgi:hypothetical protein